MQTPNANKLLLREMRVIPGEQDRQDVDQQPPPLHSALDRVTNTIESLHTASKLSV